MYYIHIPSTSLFVLTVKLYTLHDRIGKMGFWIHCWLMYSTRSCSCGGHLADMARKTSTMWFHGRKGRAISCLMNTWEAALSRKVVTKPSCCTCVQTAFVQWNTQPLITTAGILSRMACQSPEIKRHFFHLIKRLLCSCLFSFHLFLFKHPICLYIIKLLKTELKHSYLLHSQQSPSPMKYFQACPVLHWIPTKGSYFTIIFFS